MGEGVTPTDMPADVREPQECRVDKNVVSTKWNPDAPAVFDEFMREHEWELALHVVCDYLLEPTTPPAPQELIEQIESLRKAMRYMTPVLRSCGEKLSGGDGLKQFSVTFDSRFEHE